MKTVQWTFIVVATFFVGYFFWCDQQVAAVITGGVGVGGTYSLSLLRLLRVKPKIQYIEERDLVAM